MTFSQWNRRKGTEIHRSTDKRAVNLTVETPEQIYNLNNY
jgi:hypothetical protein